MRAILWLQFEEKCSEKKTKKIPPYPPVLQTTKIIKYEIAGGIGGFFFFFLLRVIGGGASRPVYFGIWRRSASLRACV